MSESVTELESLRPLRDAQQLAVMCVQHLIERPQTVQSGYSESAYYYVPDINNQAHRLFIVGSVTDIPGFARTHLLSVHAPVQVGNVLDIGEIIEAIGIEPDTGESIYTASEEPGVPCDDGKVISFIATYGVLPLIARLHSAQNEAPVTSMNGCND